MTAALTVTSEIYSESNYVSKKSTKEGNVISNFPFMKLINIEAPKIDDDGDYEVQRKKFKTGVIEIEHSQSTELKLVGLQVWRGALLLADFILHHGSKLFENEIGTTLELGSGVGLTGVVAAMKLDRVICTDVNIGGILDLIRSNVIRNKHLLTGRVDTMELDFKNLKWSPKLLEELKSVTLILSADVIYDDDLTEAFVRTIEKLLNIPPAKTLYIALEKRYVFTVADLDSVAPCYEHFLTHLENTRCKNLTREWKVEKMDIDFPQYFKYERTKELVMWKISTKCHI